MDNQTIPRPIVVDGEVCCVVHTGAHLTQDQTAALRQSVSAQLGGDKLVVVLPPGCKIEFLERGRLPAYSWERVQTRPQEDKQPAISMIGRMNGAPVKETRDGVETHQSISDYKTWLKGAGYRPCDHEYKVDGFGPAGQYICIYCRDIKNQEV
jgi:hypothetical protein